MDATKKPFNCRLCGATSYVEVFTNEIVRDVIHPDIRETACAEKGSEQIGFVCCGCSVTFQDPDKFTKSNE